MLQAPSPEPITGLAVVNDIVCSQFLKNLGVPHNNKADYESALDYYRKAKAILEKVIGPGHIDVVGRAIWPCACAERSAKS